MYHASKSCKDSCQYKELEDTGVKRPRNKVTISNINSEIFKFKTNVFTGFASTSHSWEQNFTKFSTENTVEVKQVKSDGEYLEGVLRSMVLFPPPLPRG